MQSGLAHHLPVRKLLRARIARPSDACQGCTLDLWRARGMGKEKPALHKNLYNAGFRGLKVKFGSKDFLTELLQFYCGRGPCQYACVGFSGIPLEKENILR